MAYRGFMPIAEEWTAERARALPEDGKRYEVLDGVLAVTPAPSWRHQDVSFRLHRSLQDYLERLGVGRAIGAPADVVFSSRRLLQPDLFVVPNVEGRPPGRWEDVRHLSAGGRDTVAVHGSSRPPHQAGHLHDGACGRVLDRRHRGSVDRTVAARGGAAGGVCGDAGVATGGGGGAAGYRSRRDVSRGVWRRGRSTGGDGGRETAGRRGRGLAMHDGRRGDARVCSAAMREGGRRSREGAR